MFHVSNQRFTEAAVSNVIVGKKAKTASRTRPATVPERRSNVDYQLPLLDSPLQSGVQSDRKFLAFPFFDLSKTPRRKNLKYQEATGDESIVVEVKAVDGNEIATIYDRDMLLYIASLLQQRVKTNPEIANDHKNRENRTFTFTLSDFCEATSRSRGSGYDRVEDIVERLRTTSIRTTIRTGGERTRGWFNWLSEGTYVKSREDSDEGGTFVCVVLASGCTRLSYRMATCSPSLTRISTWVPLKGAFMTWRMCNVSKAHPGIRRSGHCTERPAATWRSASSNISAKGWRNRPSGI